MYTLKVIRRFNEPVRIYPDDVPQPVNEEEQFTELNIEVKIQYQFDGYNSTNEHAVIASVLSDDIVIHIHKDETAFLMNDKGKTVKIIHRGIK